MVNSLVIDNLDEETNYIWKVRAFCTHDRETPYSAQNKFRTPKKDSGINGVDHTNIRVVAEAGRILVRGGEGLSLTVISADGRRVFSIADMDSDQAVCVYPRIYVVKVAGKSHKVIVR